MNYNGLVSASQLNEEALRAARDYTWHFIHVQKTGGTYLNHAIQASSMGVQSPPNWVGLGHSALTPQELPRPNKMWYAASESKPAKKDLLNNPKNQCITVVRNPFSLLSSWYRSNFAEVRENLGVDSFSEFIKAYCCRWPHSELKKDSAIPGMTDFISTAYYESAPSWLSESTFKKTFSQTRLKPWSDNLFFQLYEYRGGFVPLLAFRQEKLSEATKIFLEIHGVELKESLHGVKIERNVTSQSNFDYRRLYTDKTREMVEQKCAFELHSFGYNFDGPIDDYPIIVNSGNFMKYRSNPRGYLGYFG